MLRIYKLHIYKNLKWTFSFYREEFQPNGGKHILTALKAFNWISGQMCTALVDAYEHILKYKF